MIDWKHQLGIHLLKQGALSYIITDDDKQENWYEEGKTKPQVDMVVFFKDHVRIIELKETSSLVRRRFRAKQIEKYLYLCGDTRYHVQFWAYLYWNKFGTIVGTKIDYVRSVKFYVDREENPIQFWTLLDEETEIPIKKRVEFRMKVNHE